MSEALTEIREGCNETEIDLVPEDWQVVPFNSAAVVSRGISWRKTDQSPDGVPVIGIPNIRDGRVDLNIRYRIAKNVTENKRLHLGDILLVGSSGSVHNVGRAAVLRENPHPILAFASFLVKVAPKPGISDRDFLFYLVQSSLVDYAACSKRAADGKFNLHVNELKRWPIPLPPLPEQRRIAKVLSTIQEAIEQQDNLVAAARELKKSLMHHLFTHGPVSVVEAERVPLKKAEIGPMPEHWEVATLGEVCDPRRERVQPTGTGTVRYVGLEHIEPAKVRLRRHGFDDEVRSAKSRFYAHDILYGKLRPYLDKAAIPEFQGMCSTDILVLEANREKAVANFLVHLFHQQSFLSFATSTMTGTQHPRTSWRALSRFELGLPPLREQQEIASILFTVDRKVEAEQQRTAMLQELFKTMLYQLMTGQIRVKDIEV